MKTITLATAAILSAATAFGGPALAGDMGKTTETGTHATGTSAEASQDKGILKTLEDAASPERMDRSEVTAVQQALNDAGHDVTVDGLWGQQTARAVMDYQASNGLPASGDIDARTATALGLDLEDGVPTKRGDVPDTGTGTGMDADSETGVMTKPGSTDLTD